MDSKPPSSSSSKSKLEPPYCFSSIKELRKNQTRYNQYNIFHMIERLNMFKSQFGYDEPMDPIDESSDAWKMYKDFV
eukprot:scaffold30840_cov36-Cyclotella_meneghiniana.AAC.4